MHQTFVAKEMVIPFNPLFKGILPFKHIYLQHECICTCIHLQKYGTSYSPWVPDHPSGTTIVHILPLRLCRCPSLPRSPLVGFRCVRQLTSGDQVEVIEIAGSVGRISSRSSSSSTSRRLLLLLLLMMLLLLLFLLLLEQSSTAKATPQSFRCMT